MTFDSLTQGYLDSSALAACFSARPTLAHMLAFEAALSAALVEHGTIPARCLQAISAACELRHYDLEALTRATFEASNPAIPMVAALTAQVAAVDADAARYVHWGSTSQDVMDSALMLSCREALDLIDLRLLALIDVLAGTADMHRRTPMVARTLSQHAGPTSFGFKAAGWLAALLPGCERLRALNLQLPLQFGGASGTLAAFGAAGGDIGRALARRLALRACLPWHTERSVVRELGAALADISAACGKIASDIIAMAQSEVGELREAAAAGRGGSSALPHKRNPVAAIASVAAARRTPGMLSTLYSSFDHLHERAAGAWHAEGAGLRDLFVATGGALEQLLKSLEGIEIDTRAMRANLVSHQGTCMSEAVSMALAPSLGRAGAQAAVKEAVETALREQRSLTEVLAECPRVTDALDAAALDAALDPLNYLGLAERAIEEILARAAAVQAS